MLLPVLNTIKNRLTKKKQMEDLSDEETGLLKELEALDKDEVIKKGISEGKEFKRLSIFGGPSDRCPCCGR